MVTNKLSYNLSAFSFPRKSGLSSYEFPSFRSASLVPFSAQHIKAARLQLQKKDPVMKGVLKKVGPFGGKTTRDRFGTLVKSIVSQQISTSAARTIHQRLSDLVNGSTGANFKVAPEQLAKFSIEELRPAGISKQKASYLLDLATKSMTKRSIWPAFINLATRKRSRC